MRKRPLVALGIATVVAETVVVVRRRGFLFGAHTVVRCGQGHLFTTLWIPGASVKAVRLGWWRFQRCPVGRHWTFVTPVAVSGLSGAELELAAQSRDYPVP
jgi:hypothetical protein